MKFTFPLHVRVKVNGIHNDPLFRYLKRKEYNFELFADKPMRWKLYTFLARKTYDKDGWETQPIGWNMTKFLVNREGKVEKRYDQFDTVEFIEKELINMKYIKEK